jgi:hypothetical protein
VEAFEREGGPSADGLSDARAVPGPSAAALPRGDLCADDLFEDDLCADDLS